MTQCDRHPPHGGCGLKSVRFARPSLSVSHPPHGGCGLKYVVAPAMKNSCNVIPPTGDVD